MNRTVPVVNNAFYHVFLAKLFAYASEYFIRLVVYTLMPNHHHLVLTQPCGGDLPGTMDAFETSITKRFNNPVGACLVRLPEDWDYSHFRDSFGFIDFRNGFPLITLEPPLHAEFFTFHFSLSACPPL
jgi:hypothetical protein